MPTRSQARSNTNQSDKGADLERLISRLENRKDTYQLAETEGQVNVIDYVREHYRGDLDPEIIEEEIEAWRNQQRGGNPTEFRSWDEALTHHANELETNVKKLHETLNADFEGEKEITVTTPSADKPVTLSYDVNASSESKQLRIDVAQLRDEPERDYRSKGNYLFGIEAAHQKDIWNPEWPQTDYSMNSPAKIVMNPFFPIAGQACVALAFGVSEDDLSAEDLKYKRHLETYPQRASYPFKKAASSVYNALQDEEHQVAISTVETAYSGQNKSPKEFMAWIGSLRDDRADIYKLALNNVKPVTHSLYQEKIQNLSGAIEPS